MHRAPGAEVRVDLGEGPPLIGRRAERQRGEPTADQLPGRIERQRRPLGVALAAARDQRRLMQEQLLVGEPAPGRIDLGGPGWEVSRKPRVAGPGKPATHAHLRRQRLGDVRRVLQRLPDPLAQPLRPHALAGRMHRDHPRCVNPTGDAPAGAQRLRSLGLRSAGVQELVVVDPQAAPIEPAVDQQPRSGLQTLREPRLVEPARGQHAARIGDRGLDDGETPTTGRAQAHRTYLCQQRRLLPDAQLGDRRRLGTIRWECGTCSIRSPSVQSPRPAQASESFGPMPGRVASVRVEQRRRPRAAQSDATPLVEVQALAPGQRGPAHAGSAPDRSLPPPGSPD